MVTIYFYIKLISINKAYLCVILSSSYAKIEFFNYTIFDYCSFLLFNTLYYIFFCCVLHSQQPFKLDLTCKSIKVYAKLFLSMF